jgi:hypothetical protein
VVGKTVKKKLQNQMEGASRNDTNKHEFNVKSSSSSNANFTAAYSSGQGMSGGAKKNSKVGVVKKKM